MTTALLLTVTGALCAPPATASPAGDQDTAFVRRGHQVGLAEIAAGRDAARNAATPCVKAVGAALVRDHTRLDAGLSALARELGVTLPGPAAPAPAREPEDVRGPARTTAYDTAWLADRAEAQTEALALIDAQIARGDNARAVAAARVARPVVTMHLDMVRGGTCHGVRGATTSAAGSGADLAAASGNDRFVLGAAALAAGAVLAGAGLWLLSSRRRDDGGR
ncbi:DUF4142 domain-containing protein [Streptomyces sp. NPDC054861]